MIAYTSRWLEHPASACDEPTIGLHPHDGARTNGLLRRPRDEGNTLLVVEHEPEAIASADRVADLGLGAGPGGARGPAAFAPAPPRKRQGLQLA